MKTKASVEITEHPLAESDIPSTNNAELDDITKVLEMVNNGQEEAAIQHVIDAAPQHPPPSR